MKNLEKILRETQKPEARNESFRRSLRHSLLEAHSTRRLSLYRTAFACSSALSLALAGMVVIFIVLPQYPAGLHRALASNPSLPVQKPPKTAGGGEISSQWAATNVSWESQLDIDRNLVRRWAEESSLPANLESIQPVECNKTYTVNSFKLSNGREVQVYTLLPGKAKRQKHVSY